MKKLLFVMMITADLCAMNSELAQVYENAIGLEEERRVILQQINKDSTMANELSNLSESLQLELLPKLVETRFLMIKKLLKLSETQKSQALPLLARAQHATLKILCKASESLQLELRLMINEIQSIIVYALKEKLDLMEQLMPVVLESDYLIAKIPHQIPNGMQ